MTATDEDGGRGLTTNAFQPLDWIARAPRRASILGHVPVGYRTLAETAMGCELKIFSAIGASPECISYPALAAILNVILGALFLGDVESVVDSAGNGQLHRVPTRCWSNVWEQATGPNAPLQTRFSQIVASECMSGPEFGIYDGKTACLTESDADRLAARCVAQLSGDAGFCRLVGGLPKAGDWRLGADEGCARWIARAAPADEARRRAAEAGKPDVYSAIAEAFVQMAKDCGRGLVKSTIEREMRANRDRWPPKA